jgi:methylthioribose-1-phosphate isomerase
VDACNYAFDATPLELVSAVITERGVFHPPLTLEQMRGVRRTV